MRFLTRYGRSAFRRVLPLAVLAAAIALRVADPPFLQQFRHMVFDSYQRIAPRPPGEGDGLVKVVDLDDESLKRLGQWPWPRTLVAELLTKLQEAGAIAVGFDIVFSEPDRLSPARVLAHWPETPEVAALKKNLDSLPDTDAALAAAMRRGRTVGAFSLVSRQNDTRPLARAAFGYGGYDPRPFMFAFPGAVTNLDLFEKATVGNGAINWLPDQDQIVRRVPVVLRLGETIYPTLFAEMLRVAQGVSGYKIGTSAASGESDFGARTGMTAVQIGRAVVPTDGNGQMLLHFAPRDPGRYVPAWRVLDGSAPADAFRNKLVLIGTSAAGLQDLRATPLEAGVPGVDVHAQAIEQVVGGTYLSRPDYAGGTEILGLAVVGLAVILLFPLAGALWSLLLFVPLVVLSAGAGWYAFAEHRMIFDGVYPALAVLIVLSASTLVTFLRTERQRNQVRNAFAHYLSPKLVERLASDPSGLRLGGEIRPMTILFSDIRGFTGISERLDAEGLTAFMNRYLTPMTEAVLSNGGTVDKYIGDAIMAFWNAPLSDPDHPRSACRAALAMAERLDALNEALTIPGNGDGAPGRLRIGIGLNTGECCVGNFGSDQRFDYSVLGDEVNLASRLEGLARVYGATIIVGETTAAGAQGLAFVELDRVVVKGRQRPVTVHALLGDETLAENARFKELNASHAAMLAAYRARDWAGAREALKKARALGFEELAETWALYEARIAAFEADPPPEDWDGVWIADRK